MNDRDRRIVDAEWKGKMIAYQEQQVESLKEIKETLRTQNSRIGRLERWRSWIVGIGSAALVMLGVRK